MCQNQDLYRAELRQSDTVVSCVGGFGKTDAYMGLVNGEANIKLAEVCLCSHGLFVCACVCVVRRLVYTAPRRIGKPETRAVGAK